MRRKVGLFLVFGAVLPLGAISTAWACGVLATLKLDSRTVAPGQSIVAKGLNYSTAPGASAVTIRLKKRNGPVLDTVTPSRAITSTFTLPSSLKPGWYVILATQYKADGTPVAGTPGRTTVRVQGPSSSATVASPWGRSTPSGPSGTASAVARDAGSAPVLPMLLAAILSLAMLAGGWTVLGRRNRIAGHRLSV